MKTTKHFREDVRRKRLYLKDEWIELALAKPDEKMLQPNGRISYYKYIAELDKFLRVVTLEDGETVHTVYPDRNYKPRQH